MKAAAGVPVILLRERGKKLSHSALEPRPTITNNNFKSS